MDINLRISTSSTNLQDSSNLTEPTSNNKSEIQQNPSNNSSALDSSDSITPQQNMQEAGMNTLGQKSSYININNNISTNPSQFDTPQTNSTNSEVNSNDINKTNDDWAKSLITEMKGMFDSFFNSLTKLIESIFGAKSGNTTSQTLTSTPTNNTSQTTTSTVPSTDSSSKTNRVVESFIAHTAKNLGADLNNNITEEKMRESVIMYQLYQKDEEAENVFKTALTQNKSNGKSSDDAIKAALIETEKSNKIERWESDWVYSLSFQAAQLDNDFSNVSGISNNLPAAAAIQTAERNLVSIASGSATPLQRSIAA